MDDLETIDHKICRLVRYYVRMVGGRDTVAIAKFAGIGIATMPLSNVAGYYTLVQRKRWICINEDIPSDSLLFKVVVAHELGHALLHRKENCDLRRNILSCLRPVSNGRRTSLLRSC